MFEISVSQDFAAAHRLNDYHGKCRNVHGHTWKVELRICSEDLNASGMVVDFKDIKAALRDILESYDHSFLNESDPFDKINPTAENIAREIYLQFKNNCPDINLITVSVWESANCCAMYREGI
jgi:6-pyruvoyltetrahydropterin/6-carboxytetrahydropterin synthase